MVTCTHLSLSCLPPIPTSTIVQQQIASGNIITRGMLSIFGERERPNLSSGCMSNAFRQRERNALPFSMVFVSTSTYLRAYTVDLQLQMKAYPSNHRTCGALTARAKTKTVRRNNARHGTDCRCMHYYCRLTVC